MTHHAVHTNDERTIPMCGSTRPDDKLTLGWELVDCPECLRIRRLFPTECATCGN